MHPGARRGVGAPLISSVSRISRPPWYWNFSRTWRPAAATRSARAIRDSRPCKPSFATSRAANQLWLLSAALSWLFRRRRRFVLYLLGYLSEQELGHLLAQNRPFG